MGEAKIQPLLSNFFILSFSRPMISCSSLPLYRRLHLLCVPICRQLTCPSFRTICNMRGCHSFHAFLIKSSKKGLPIYWRWRGRLGTIVRKNLLYLFQYILTRSQIICHDATRPMHLQNSGHLSNSTGSPSLSFGFSTHVHFLPMYFPHFLELRHIPLLIRFFRVQKWGMSENLFL